jgi:hypothetical protein
MYVAANATLLVMHPALLALVVAAFTTREPLLLQHKKGGGGGGKKGKGGWSDDSDVRYNHRLPPSPYSDINLTSVERLLPCGYRLLHSVFLTYSHSSL